METENFCCLFAKSGKLPLMSEILPFMFLILPEISILGIRSVARHAWQRSDTGVGILTFSVPF